MTRLSSLLYCLVLVLVHGFARDARAEEWLRLDPLRWEAFVRFDGRWEKDASSEKIRDLDLEEGLRFRQTGYSLDPRIANFSLEFEPVFNQSDFDSTAARDEYRDGLTLSYNGQVNLLQGTPGPIGVTAHATRSNTTLDGNLGSETDVDSRNWGAGLNWKTNLFPTTLSYEESSTDQRFRAGLTSASSERDELRRTVRLRGRSTKMDLSLEREWFDDRTTTDNDSTTNRARLEHRLGWGKGSRLTSRVDYLDRNKFNPFERLFVDESLDLQHTSNLSSSTDYQFTLTEQDVDTTEHLGRFQLIHQFYENLTTSGHALGSFRDAEITEETIYEGGLDFAYRKKIFRNASFRAGLGGSYRVTDRETSDGVLTQDREPHVVTSSLQFLLNRRFVDQPSIFLVDESGDCPTSGCTLGTDYQVFSVAGDLTQIVINTAAGRITVGETVFVTYDYQPQPSEKFSTTDLHYDVGLDFGWIAVYRDYSRQDEGHISGANATSLIDREDSRTGVELRWLHAPTSATLIAERRFLRSGGFDSETFSFRQSAVHVFGPGLTLNFGASQNFTDADNQDTDLYTADLSVTWRPLRSQIFIRPNASAWMREDTGSSVTGGKREERFLNAGLDLRWSWRKLDVDMLYDHQIRRGDVNEKDEDRVMMTITRRF